MPDVTVTVVGRLTHDPRLIVTEGGTPLARFRLASAPRRFDRASGTWVDGTASYYSVSCWRWLGQNVADSLRRGDPVVVVGRQRVREWERDGQTMHTVEIEADGVGHDLTWGTTTLTRVPRQGTTQRERVAGHAPVPPHDRPAAAPPQEVTPQRSGPAVPDEPRAGAGWVA